MEFSSPGGTAVSASNQWAPEAWPFDTGARGTDTPGHLVQFYEGDAFIVGRGGKVYRCWPRAGEAAVVIATNAHVNDLEERLGACGFNTAVARETRPLCLVGCRGDFVEAHGRWVAG